MNMQNSPRQSFHTIHQSNKAIISHKHTFTTHQQYHVHVYVYTDICLYKLVAIFGGIKCAAYIIILQALILKCCHR